MRNTYSQHLIALILCALALPIGSHAASSSTSTAALTTAVDAHTRYPIVLVHGLLGFDRILGVDYWYQIPNSLRKAGATVLVAQVSAVNDNDVRGEQLLQQLKAWQAAYGYTRFNLIGHSQGAPTARYAAGVAPQLVASVTSVGGANTIDTSLPPNSLISLLISQPKVVADFGVLIDWLSGASKVPQDPAALLTWAQNTEAFNARFPAGKPTQSRRRAGEQRRLLLLGDGQPAQDQFTRSV
jgi:triacylglycerol lipase